MSSSSIHWHSRLSPKTTYETNDQLMKEILNQLVKAAGDKRLFREMELEEMAQREYENAFGAMERKMAKQAADLSAMNKTIAEKDKALEEYQKYVAELLKKIDNK